LIWSYYKSQEIVRDLRALRTEEKEQEPEWNPKEEWKQRGAQHGLNIQDAKIRLLNVSQMEMR